MLVNANHDVKIDRQIQVDLNLNKKRDHEHLLKYAKERGSLNALIIYGREDKNKVILKSSEKKFSANYFINACGLQSDRVTKLDLQNIACENIVPFRGTYYHLKK